MSKTSRRIVLKIQCPKCKETITIGFFKHDLKDGLKALKTNRGKQ